MPPERGPFPIRSLHSYAVRLTLFRVVRMTHRSESERMTMVGKTMLLGSAMIAAMATTPVGAQPRDGSIADVAAGAASVTPREDGIDYRKGRLVMRITALTDSVLRIRIGRDGTLPEDASWAVLPAMRAASARVTPTSDGFRTDALVVK